MVERQDQYAWPLFFFTRRLMGIVTVLLSEQDSDWCASCSKRFFEIKKIVTAMEERHFPPIPGISRTVILSWYFYNLLTELEEMAFGVILIRDLGKRRLKKRHSFLKLQQMVDTQKFAALCRNIQRQRLSLAFENYELVRAIPLISAIRSQMLQEKMLMKIGRAHV